MTTSPATDLHDFFSQRRARGEPMVLATVVQTAGSTYRKAGAQMLIAQDGTAAGLLSGGCLEGDLIARAERVLRTRVAEMVSYDSRSEDDLLWGIGLGCEGAMNILLTPLYAGNDYQPFAFIDSARALRTRTAFGIVIQPNAHLPLGQAFALDDDRRTLMAIGNEAKLAVPDVHQRQHTMLPAAPLRAATLSTDGALILLIPIELSLNVLLLGAGPDVQPLARIAAVLGWQTTIVDHRPAYAVAERFPSSARVLVSAAAAVGAAVDLNAYDAAVVMSHHLVSDGAYLRALAHSSVPYIGLLGPAPRRARLLRELGTDGSAKLTGRLRGPVGLDIGASTPETIALAIASEIQTVLSGHSGQPFSNVAGD